MNLKEVEPDQIPFLANFIVVEKDTEIPIDWKKGYIVFRKTSENKAFVNGVVSNDGLSVDKSSLDGGSTSIDSLFRSFGRKPFLVSKDFVTIPECFV